MNLKPKYYSRDKISEYRIKYPWMSHYTGAKWRCRPDKKYGKKGRKFILTKEEIKTIWFRDKAYELKFPSIHRIDNDGHYEFKNCCFIECGLNTILTPKHRTKDKVVHQYSKDGKLIKTFESCALAAKEYGVTRVAIATCARGTYKTSCGFLWRYAERKAE